MKSRFSNSYTIFLKDRFFIRVQWVDQISDSMLFEVDSSYVFFFGFFSPLPGLCALPRDWRSIVTLRERGTVNSFNCQFAIRKICDWFLIVVLSAAGPFWHWRCVLAMLSCWTWFKQWTQRCQSLAWILSMRSVHGNVFIFFPPNSSIV